VNGRGLDVLVSREGIHVCAPFEQETRRVDMSEEAGEAERVKAVVAECVRERRILVEQLAQPVRAADRRSLEDVEARVGGEQLIHSRPVASVQRLQQARHQRSNRDRRRSLRTRPPVWHSGQ
jgi:hypothetical protein